MEHFKLNFSRIDYKVFKWRQKKNIIEEQTKLLKKMIKTENVLRIKHKSMFLFWKLNYKLEKLNYKLKNVIKKKIKGQTVKKIKGHTVKKLEGPKRPICGTVLLNPNQFDRLMDIGDVN